MVAGYTRLAINLLLNPSAAVKYQPPLDAAGDGRARPPTCCGRSARPAIWPSAIALCLISGILL
jgi:hypothetical protein